MSIKQIFYNKWVRRVVIALGSVMLAAFLIFSISILNYFMHGSGKKSQDTRKTEISIRQAPPPPPEQKKKKPARRPERSKPSHRNVKSGPRFAMDLGVAGMGDGVGISMDLVKDRSGGGGASGDVDSRPQSNGRSSFKPPQTILDKEIDSYLRMSFCVDAQGRAYDIKVLEERPGGLGLGDAGRSALGETAFEPARKDGQPVPFCGMEQPFEIRFKG
jgi:hypothetical protein